MSERDNLLMVTFPQPCSTHMQDLQEVTQDLHYENFRSERLKRGGRLSSHGYILPLSPAYVLVRQLASLHLPHLKQQTFNWKDSVRKGTTVVRHMHTVATTDAAVVKLSQSIHSCLEGRPVKFCIVGHVPPVSHTVECCWTSIIL